MHAKNSEKVLFTTGAKESEVLENILPQQKKKTTVNTLRIQRRYLYSGDSDFLYRFTVFRAFLSRLCHVRFECVTETFLKRKWRFKR